MKTVLKRAMATAAELYGFFVKDSHRSHQRSCCSGVRDNPMARIVRGIDIAQECLVTNRRVVVRRRVAL